MTVIMSDVAPTFDLGVERYRAGAYAEAEAIFARLHAAQEQVPEEAQKAADAGDAATLRMLGLARFRLGKLEPALALLEAALEAAPADPETQLHYGLVLHAAGRHAEAAAQFRSSAKLLPLDPAPHMNLSAALLALGDAAGAVRAAKHARRRDANLPQVHYMLGLASMAADRLDDAIRAFAAALQLDPKLADALVNIGVICYRRNDIEGAKTAMRGALAVAPGHIGAASNLGAFLRLTGQVEASEKLLDDVLARDPEAAEVRVNQAAALLSEGRPREALVLLDAKSVPADPRLAQHWQMQRSLALLQVGRHAEAREVVLPVCIKAGALGDNVPKRDLWISPHHAMYFEGENGGMLIEAKDLVNGTSIVQAQSVEKVEYFHIELDTHDVIVAEGALSETFLDGDNRGIFHNAHEYDTLYSDAPSELVYYCALRIEEGYELEGVRRRIASRAGQAADANLGALRGYVDATTATHIKGWAQNVDCTEMPVCLDVYVGSQLIGQALANRYRDDLAKAGLGGGRHSFVFRVPAGVTLTPETVEVRRSFDGAPLKRSASTRRKRARAAVG